MQKIMIAFVALGLAASAHADNWSKTYQVSGRPDLAVRTSDANIHVDTWDQNTIEASVSTLGVKIGEGGIHIEEHQTGNVVEVEVRIPNQYVNFGMRRHHVDINVHMPREGTVNLQTGDASITLSHLKGDMQTRSGDGHQEIDAVEGMLHAHAGDGYIHAAGRFDELDASTGDGKIEARALPGSTIASSWSLHAGDGNVALQLPDGFAADVEIHTGDGHINLDLPVAVDGRLTTNNLHGKLNGGGKLLSIHTGDGSIELGKLAGAL